MAKSHVPIGQCRFGRSAPITACAFHAAGVSKLAFVGGTCFLWCFFVLTVTVTLLEVDGAHSPLPL
jgi:hypothetical protein